MDLSSIILLSSEAALRRRLDVTANNVANINTTGFKREAPLFREMVEPMPDADAPAAGGRRVSYVIDVGVAHDTSQGPFQATGNPLDAMIDGVGYFQLRRADGSLGYTRAGRFSVSADGQLTGPGGHVVLSEAGQPIAVQPDDVGRLSLAVDGTLSGPSGELGRIGVFRFAEEAGAEQAGDNLFEGAGAVAVARGEVRLKTGGVEGSNVNAVAESAELVEIMRSYEASRRIAEGINDLRRRSIERLGRAN